VKGERVSGWNGGIASKAGKLTRSVLEAGEVRGGSNGALVVEVGGNLSVLLVNLGRVHRSAENARKGPLSGLVATLHDEVARRLGEDGKSNSENCRVVEVSANGTGLNSLKTTHWRPR